METTTPTTTRFESKVVRSGSGTVTHLAFVNEAGVSRRTHCGRKASVVVGDHTDAEQVTCQTCNNR